MPTHPCIRGRAALVLLCAGALGIGAAMPAARAATVSVLAPDTKGAKGKEVSIPVRVVGAPGLGAMHVELTFDRTVLEPLSASAGKLAADGALVDSNPTPGRLIMGLVTSGKLDGDGEVFVAKFRVIGNKGATSPLGLEKVAAWEATLDRLEVGVTTTPGTFTVGGGSAFPWWILAVVAALLLLLLFVLLKRRRREEEPVAAPVAVVAAPVAAAPAAPAPPAFSPAAPTLPPGAYHCTVDAEQVVVDSAGLTVATLAPGRTYVAVRTVGEWTEVDDGAGHVGWIPAHAVRR